MTRGTPPSTRHSVPQAAAISSRPMLLPLLLLGLLLAAPLLTADGTPGTAAALAPRPPVEPPRRLTRSATSPACSTSCSSPRRSARRRGSAPSNCRRISERRGRSSSRFGVTDRGVWEAPGTTPTPPPPTQTPPASRNSPPPPPPSVGWRLSTRTPLPREVPNGEHLN